MAEAYESFEKANTQGFMSLVGKKGIISEDGRTITQQSKNMKWVYVADETGRNLKYIELYRDEQLLGKLWHSPRIESDSFMRVVLPEGNNLEFASQKLFDYRAPSKTMYGKVTKNTVTGVERNHKD